MGKLIGLKNVLMLAVMLIGCLVHGAMVECLAQTATSGPPVLLQMIRDSAVHAELKLSTKQKVDVLAALREVDGAWFRSRNLKSDKRGQEIRDLTATLEKSLEAILSVAQTKRLYQLQLQALGTRMLTREDVAETLMLSRDQRDALEAAFQATDQAIAQLSDSAKEMDQNTQVQELKQAERDLVAKQLTQQQQRQFGDLVGSAFDFSSVRRTYPLAPELTLDGAAWMQGGPLKLADLKGKVVAVHFYAFQCINCQRNLPHYKAWWKDYEDRGLVVIGLQTPETSAERSPGKVQSAAKRDGIEYPVLLDMESANWKKWSNTMWPTVYLIDRQGFLRRWWQGELNWQGGNGEQQMRLTIEQLLSEQD